MSISVSNIIANPSLYRNDYNDYSPYNAYYNYYDEYRNHAHPYEHDYEEKNAKEMELIANSYHKPSLEELDAQVRSAWEKIKEEGKLPSQELFLSTDITDHDEYVKKIREEKEARGLDAWLIPLTRAEEEEQRERERSTPKNIKMGSYDFMNGGFSYLKDNLKDNMVIWLEGARFSKSEFEECSSILKKATNLLPSIAKGGFMDYMEYALLGVAYNVVNTYAAENLTSEQQKVLSQSMQAYLDTYILADQEYLLSHGDDFSTNDDAFYGIRYKDGSVWPSATNEELAQSLRTMFEKVDLRDQNAVNAAFSQYQNVAAMLASHSGAYRGDYSLEIKLSNASAILNSVGKEVNYSI
ncbi:MAG: hypothetical protein HDR12_08755 [Lachnospiraceae bacterium]|nr:hypothetical protein [Lachnospiraceae bacterium]